MSDSDFDLDQLKDVDLTQLGGEEGDGDDVFRTGGGACDEVANSFSKISVTNVGTRLTNVRCWPSTHQCSQMSPMFRLG